MRFISKEQHDFYWENGYLVVEEFFSSGEAENLYETAKKIATSDFKTILNLDREADVLSQNPASKEEDREALANIIKWVQFHPRMVGILEELYAREMATLQSIILFKENGSPYQSTAWNPHQDNSYIQNKNNLYLAVGYPLMDFFPENGGFYIYPGSHKEGILPFELNNAASKSKVGENPGNKSKIPDKYEKLDIRLKKGDALIFHGNLVHGSYANESDKSRPLIVINYLPWGEDFISGRTSKRVMTRCH
jgi:phytanoyl-CoA hydroxylase